MRQTTMDGPSGQLLSRVGKLSFIEQWRWLPLRPFKHVAPCASNPLSDIGTVPSVHTLSSRCMQVRVRVYSPLQCRFFAPLLGLYYLRALCTLDNGQGSVRKKEAATAKSWQCHYALHPPMRAHTLHPEWPISRVPSSHTPTSVHYSPAIYQPTLSHFGPHFRHIRPLHRLQ